MKNKKLISIVAGAVGFIAAFLVFFFVFTGKEDAAPRDFSYGEFAITLTEDFVKEEGNEKYSVSFNTDRIIVTVLREGFELLEGFENYTLEEYGNIIISNGSLQTKLVKLDNCYSFEYSASPDGISYHYTYYLYKGKSAFFMIGFMTLEADKDAYKDEIEKYASSIRIDEESESSEGTDDGVCKNHSYGEWEVITAATCGKKGSQKRTCSVCGETENQSIAKNENHEFLANKKCKLCGKKMNDGFTFTKLSTGTYSFKYSGYDEHITVPETFDGIAVTKIDDRAFNNCQSIKTVTLPDSITEIGSNAFNGCNNLERVNTPKNLTKIGYSAFSDCLYLTSFEIPEAVTRIEMDTFSGCIRLASVNIPKNTTYIGSSAFEDCAFKSVTIPATVTEIGNQAFASCRKLNKVTFEDGIKISKISKKAFYATGITEITIPGSVTEIGDEAFSSCFSLGSITIPKSIKKIGNKAFFQSAGTLAVNYSGKESEWKKISIASDLVSNTTKVKYNYAG